MADNIVRSTKKISTKKALRRSYKVDLASYIEVCDGNYYRFMELFPGIAHEKRAKVVVTIGGRQSEVSIEILEQSPYTSLVSMSCLPDEIWQLTKPLIVRLYHDARSAEVVEYQKNGYFRAKYEQTNSEGRLPDEKGQMNRFLSEILIFCAKYEIKANDAVSI
tara:strand:- start:2074 stop:2562 length:489 start_codon:yes stop_codon:yes gene_type:complete